LVVPRSEAEAKITAQIQRGKEILEAHRRGELDDDNADIEKDKWTNYNKELLRRLFDDDKPAREYSRAANAVFTEFSGNPFYGEPDPRLGRSQTDEEITAYINALDDLNRRLELFPEAVPLLDKHSQGHMERGSEVFIVHGHDDGAKNTVARFIERIGLKPIVLHEQPDDGRTLIEKFEHYSRVGFAVILMTPDDVGASATSQEKLHPRARQNVILELGFFLGGLGRRFV
jgi:hypothetical protein